MCRAREGILQAMQTARHKTEKGQVWHMQETKRKKPVWLKDDEEVKVGGGTGEASRGQTMWLRDHGKGLWVLKCHHKSLIPYIALSAHLCKHLLICHTSSLLIAPNSSK